MLTTMDMKKLHWVIDQVMHDAGRFTQDEMEFTSFWAARLEKHGERAGFSDRERQLLKNLELKIIELAEATRPAA